MSSESSEAPDPAVGLTVWDASSGRSARVEAIHRDRDSAFLAEPELSIEAAASPPLDSRWIEWATLAAEDGREPARWLAPTDLIDFNPES